NLMVALLKHQRFSPHVHAFPYKVCGICGPRIAVPRYAKRRRTIGARKVVFIDEAERVGFVLVEPISAFQTNCSMAPSVAKVIDQVGRKNMCPSDSKILGSGGIYLRVGWSHSGSGNSLIGACVSNKGCVFAGDCVVKSPAVLIPVVDRGGNVEVIGSAVVIGSVRRRIHS